MHGGSRGCGGAFSAQAVASVALEYVLAAFAAGDDERLPVVSVQLLAADCGKRLGT